MKTLWTVIIIIFLFAGSTDGRSLSELTRIRDFKVLSAQEEMRLVIQTGRDLPYPPELTVLNDKLLQLEIEGSYTDPPKRTFQIEDSFLNKVDIYQLDSETVRIRLHLNTPFPNGGGYVQLEDGGFLISLKRDEVMTGKGGFKNPVHDIEDSFPTIFGNKDERAVDSEEINKNYESPKLVGKMAASLALVIGLFLVGSYLFREKILKKRGMASGQLIKVIDRGYIDMKKGIAIVDVAGEVLVLGTSGENITMLTKLDSEEALKKIKPLYKRSTRASFPHAVKAASQKMASGTSEALIDKVRSLKPLT